MKLHFICPGAPKCATTTLYDILVQHPDISLPLVKETNFFAYTNLFNNGLHWYEREYYSQGEKKYVGEISTAYMSFAKIACERIESSYGNDIKFIFLLRNPVDRAYSHYCMRRYNNNAENESFKVLVKRIAQQRREVNVGLLSYLSKGYSNISKIHLDDWRYLHYFYNGLYNEIIKEFLGIFQRNNMKFIIFEDFVENPMKQILNILTFLDIKPKENIQFNLHSNISGKIKYPVLHKLLKKVSSNRKLKNTVTKIFGHSNITRGYYFLKNRNRTPHVPPEIDEETEMLLHKFYEKDINDLQNTISVKLVDWKMSKIRGSL